MEKFIKKYGLWILGLAAIIVFVVFAVKKGWFKDKAAEIDPKTASKDGSEVTISDSQAQNMAKGIHDQLINYANFFDSNGLITKMQPLVNMTDSNLVVVANKYASMYAGEEMNTLSSALAGEYLGWGEVNSMRDRLVGRLTELGV